MKISQYHLSFIGFGHMAQILFQAIHRARLIPPSQIYFVQRDRDKMKRNEQAYRITATSLEHAASASDVLLLCVRPKQAPGVLAELVRHGAQGKKVISILAGVSIPSLQKSLGSEAQVARLMPNVASAIGEGMTSLSFSPSSQEEFRSFVQQLAAPLGRSIGVSEEHMDLATALAGSGPGFVFTLIQAMAGVGIKGGLPETQALLLAAQTFLGASRLVREGGEISSLLEQIATPGGVTEAGLQEMERLEIPVHLQQVIKTAWQKARDLGSE